jgi:hypothetical protein
VDDLDRFSAAWYAEDWRGQKGQAPTPAQVLIEWGKYASAQRRPTKVQSNPKTTGNAAAIAGFIARMGGAQIESE